MKYASFLFALLLSCGAVAQTITPAPSAGNGLALPGGFKTGRFYGPMASASPSNVALGVANQLYAQPIFVPNAITAQSLSFDIGTGNASAWNARMCIYADTGAGLPGSLVTDTGTIAIASGSVTGVQTATLNGGNGVALGAGWYWLAFMADSNAESLYSVTSSSAANLTNTILGGEVPARLFTSYVTSVFKSQTFGACPATFGAASYSTHVASPWVIVGF